jgi:hypothetical protein
MNEIQKDLEVDCKDCGCEDDDNLKCFLTYLKFKNKNENTTTSTIKPNI